MTSNTVEDLLKTADKGSNYITCPACGSPLSIRNQGLEMILTEEFRNQLDTSVSAFRLFLIRIENYLKQRNIPIQRLDSGIYPYSGERNFYSEVTQEYEEEESDDVTEKRFLNFDGTYKNTVGENAAEEFVKKTLDFFQYIKNFDNFPLRDEKDLDYLYRSCKSLIKGLDPRSISSPLIDLILMQPDVIQWREKLELEPGKKTLDQILQEVCPTLRWYLNKALELHSKEKDDDSLPRAVLTTQLVLALFLGHKSNLNYGLDILSVPKNVRYTLPLKTVVSYASLVNLLHSEVVLGNSNLGLSPQFVETLKSSKEQFYKQQSQTPSENKSLSAEELIYRVAQQWKKEIPKLIHFTCTGEVGLNKKLCGWYPKQGETHSIILLGSPGSSKSSTLLTGLVAFCDYIASIRATVSLDLPDDRAIMSELAAAYRRGDIPNPTRMGDQTSIKLSVVFPEIDPFKKTHFVFTDIPGEDLARSLTDEGALSWIHQILKTANTIISFFDLSIEPTIREKLTKTRNSEIWKPVLENYERVNNSRKGKAAVGQFDLLEQLINDLQKHRGNLEGMNFICVIPKADLYAQNDGEKDRMFFTSFFEKLASGQLLVKSDFDKQDDESFDGLCSLGGTAFKSRENKEQSPRHHVLVQKEVGRFISNEARACLLKIGNALGEDAVSAFKVALTDLIQVRLIIRLEATFGKDRVYFLPVSAFGKDTSKQLENIKSEGEGKMSLGRTPNQKLSEYVFLLPAVLAIADSLESKSN